MLYVAGKGKKIKHEKDNTSSLSGLFKKILEPRDFLEVLMHQCLLGAFPIHKDCCIWRPSLPILARETMGAQPCQKMADNIQQIKIKSWK